MPNKKKSRPDFKLLVILLALVIVGIIALTSASVVISQQKFENSAYYLFHQLIAGIIPGIILGFVAYKINLEIIKKLSLAIFSGSIILMALVFLPKIGIGAWGATRWLDFGLFSIQPSEFLKLAFILYLSTLLSKRLEKANSGAKPNWKLILLPFLAVVGLIGGLLLLQSDLSTLGIICIVALGIYFSAGTPIWHTLLLIAMGGASAFAFIIFEPYRFKRLMVFLNPEQDPMGIGFQIKQATIAVGSGGIFGLGLGALNQKLGFIPQSMSDAVFTVFAKETGFIGCLFLILILLAFAWLAFRLSKMCPDRFSQLFVVGYTCWICSQAFLNIGAMIGLLPLIGIPLPFLSYGGSHVLVELIGAGILLNISKFRER